MQRRLLDQVYSLARYFWGNKEHRSSQSSFNTKYYQKKLFSNYKQCWVSHILLRLKIQPHFLLLKIPQLQEVLVCLQGGSHDSFLFHKFRQLCSLFSLLAICRDEEVCTDVGSEQNKLLLSSYFWQSPISPSPTRSKEVISFVSPLLPSICLSSWLF